MSLREPMATKREFDSYRESKADWCSRIYNISTKFNDNRITTDLSHGRTHRLFRRWAAAGLLRKPVSLSIYPFITLKPRKERRKKVVATFQKLHDHEEYRQFND